jgi:squalene-hopene/tetraprenyl-beta-curcumene cyclase
MKAGMLGIRALLACLASVAMVACSHPATKVSNSWDPKAAAAYLDYRAGWWSEWTGSARDHGTFCISCHTALPYALSRPALRVALAESGPSVNERKLIENVTKRVRLWKDVGPYYSDQGYDGKTAESRGTESVLNALILASYDAQNSHLSDDTRAAFDNMWALQQTAGENAGSWPWLQFDQEPWEANDSGYYGAALAAMAVGMAPGNYASTDEIQANLTRLREYLNRESAAQSTINRVFLLWASTKLPGLLSPEQQKAIIHEALSKQQSDGGWRLASISWKWSGWSLKSLGNMWIREDGTPMEGKSDGLATSLLTLVLQQAGVAADNPQLRHGLSWLMSNQNAAEGFWPASSVNKRRHISSDTGRFMSDAATAFAVLALTENQRTAGQVASAGNH